MYLAGQQGAHRRSQPVLPRLGVQGVTAAPTGHVMKARKMQMHSCYEQLVGRDLIQHSFARFHCLLVVNIEVRAGIGQGNLNFWEMNNVAPDQQLLSRRRDHESGVSRCVSGYGYGYDARKYFSAAEQT